MTHARAVMEKNTKNATEHNNKYCHGKASLYMEKMDPLDFWKKYKLIASTKKFKVERGVLKVCRFCGKNEEETSFKTKAHVLPELMGENNLTSSEECDVCNNKFSAFESHLSIFFRPYLTAVGVKGKKKVPEFHSRTIDNNEDTRTVFKYETPGKRKLLLGNVHDYKVDAIEKKGSFTFRLPPHKPKYIYKALLKIALSILPKQKISKYQNLYDWLSGLDDSCDYFCTAFITVLKGKKFAFPSGELYEAKRVMRKNSFIPELTLIVKFGNITVQIFLPLSQNFDYPASNGKSPELNIYPAFTLNADFEEVKKTQKIRYCFTSYELNSEESVSYDSTIHFTFKELDENIHNAT